jgi:hypothetical protein
MVDQRMLRTLTFTPWSGKPVVYRRRGVSADPITVVAWMIDVNGADAPSLVVDAVDDPATAASRLAASPQPGLLLLDTQPAPLNATPRRHRPGKPRCSRIVDTNRCPYHRNGPRS